MRRAETKREVARGDLEASTVVDLVPWETESMTIAELLGAQRRWGRTRARKLLSQVQIAENKRLGDLTSRQRALVVTALRAR